MSEWQDVCITACKAALLIFILDALRLTKNASWFEEHGACAWPQCSLAASRSLTRPSRLAPAVVDFVSMQALLFNGAARSWWQQTRTLVRL